jgi:hypothetical protein
VRNHGLKEQKENITKAGARQAPIRKLQQGVRLYGVEPFRKVLLSAFDRLAIPCANPSS